jgi:carbamoyl-phosphate synthase small subunit
MGAARLVFEDGTVFDGTSFGADGSRVGELVFHTGMTGYQEVLTDPSYAGQIVTMTYPHIGTYGITRDDHESTVPAVYGFVVREASDVMSNWRAQYTVGAFLRARGIIGISGVDTRMITRLIRNCGTIRALVTTDDQASNAQLVLRVRTTDVLRNPVARVSTPYVQRIAGSGPRIVLIDFGAKAGIVRELVRRQCDVVVVPHDTDADAIRAYAPDGVLLSNGPGDPCDVPYAVETVRALLGAFPMFGICLGHQLFALACGATTSKLMFGHRGSNHPVRDMESGACYMTSQNHGYTVDSDSIARTRLVITQVNNNDLTIEGLRHSDVCASSVQYHPEASPGPDDTNGVFDAFLTSVRNASGRRYKQEAK